MHAQCHACIGGTNVREDIRKLEQGVHVVVGTPGRVYDMIQRRALRTSHIKLFVLDEADEMLSRGFKEQIHDVFKQLPNEVQVKIENKNNYKNLTFFNNSIKQIQIKQLLNYLITKI